MKEKLLETWWIWFLLFALLHLPKLAWIGIGFDLQIYLDVFHRVDTLGVFSAYRTDALGFSYAPLMLILMRPLTWIESERVLFFMVSLCSWAALFCSFKLIFSWLSLSKKQTLGVLFLTLLAMQRVMDHSINFGQSNAFILLCVLLSLHAGNNTKPKLSGLCLALAMSFKVTPGIFLLYFIARRRFKVIAWTVIWLVGLNGGAGALLVGGDFPALFGAYVDALGYLSTQHEVASFNFSIFRILREFSSGVWVKPLFATIALVSTVLFVFRRRAINLGQPSRDTLYDWSVLFLFMQLFSPVSWFHHQVVLLLPVMLFCTYLVEHRHSRLGWSLYCVYMLIMTGVVNFLPHMSPLSHIKNQEHLSLFTFSMLTLLLGLCVMKARYPQQKPLVAH